MISDPYDWTAAAYGRVFSVATAESGAALGARQRYRVRQAIGHGHLPDDGPALLYATPLARDLDRMRMPDGHPRLLGVVIALWGAIAAIDGRWLLAVAFCLVAGWAAAHLVRRKAHQARYPSVVLAGYARLSESERRAFDFEVRSPAQIPGADRVAGHLILTVAYSAMFAVSFSTVTFMGEEAIDGSFVVVLALGLAVATQVMNHLQLRRRWMRELVAEPRPPATFEAQAR